MKRRLLYSLVLSFLVLCATCSGEKSQTLDRRTAQELIRKSAKAQDYISRNKIAVTIPSIFYIEDQYDYLPFFVLCHQAQAASNKLFYEKLVAADLLAAKPPRRGTEYDGNYHPRPSTLYEYTPSDPNADVIQAAASPDAVGYIAPGIISLVIATARFGNVTGVTQNGADADAEVEVIVDSTPISSKLSSGISETASGTDNERANGQCQPIWRRVLSEQNSAAPYIGKTRTIMFHFKRYDDGWRIV